jgi:hypothetical protein
MWTKELSANWDLLLNLVAPASKFYNAINEFIILYFALAFLATALAASFSAPALSIRSASSRASAFFLAGVSGFLA